MCLQNQSATSTRPLMRDWCWSWRQYNSLVENQPGQVWAFWSGPGEGLRKYDFIYYYSEWTIYYSCVFPGSLLLFHCGQPSNTFTMELCQQFWAIQPQSSHIIQRGTVRKYFGWIVTPYIISCFCRYHTRRQIQWNIFLVHEWKNKKTKKAQNPNR